jgi:hypothetical protein
MLCAVDDDCVAVVVVAVSGLYAAVRVAAAGVEG